MQRMHIQVAIQIEETQFYMMLYQILAPTIFNHHINVPFSQLSAEPYALQQHFMNDKKAEFNKLSQAFLLNIDPKDEVSLHALSVSLKTLHDSIEDKVSQLGNIFISTLSFVLNLLQHTPGNILCFDRAEQLLALMHPNNPYLGNYHLTDDFSSAAFKLHADAILLDEFLSLFRYYKATPKIPSKLKSDLKTLSNLLRMLPTILSSQEQVKIELDHMMRTPTIALETLYEYMDKLKERNSEVLKQLEVLMRYDLFILKQKFQRVISLTTAERFDSLFKDLSTPYPIYHAYEQRLFSKPRTVRPLTPLHTPLLSIKDETGNTILHTLIQSRRFDTALNMIVSTPHNIDLNQVNAKGDTLLHMAALEGQSELVRTLLLFGANPWIKNQELCGQLPIHYAAMAGHEIICQLLLSQREGKTLKGSTPLHYAVQFHKPSAVRALMQFDNEAAQAAYVNERNENGDTALMLTLPAFGTVDQALIQFLLEHHADPDLTNHRGVSFRMAAQHCPHLLALMRPQQRSLETGDVPLELMGIFHRNKTQTSAIPSSMDLSLNLA